MTEIDELYFDLSDPEGKDRHIDKAASLEFNEGNGIRLPRGKGIEIKRSDGKPLAEEDIRIITEAFSNIECEDDETEKETEEE